MATAALLIAVLLATAKPAPPPVVTKAGPFEVGTEKGAKASYPVILRGPAGSEALAAMLRARGEGRARGCDNGVEDDHYAYESEVVFADARFFTLRESASFDCGGPHRNYPTTTTTFHVSTGKPLDEKASLDPSLTTYELLRLAAVHDAGFVTPEKSCLENVPGYRIAVVEDGIFFWVEYPHARLLCTLETTISRDVLKRWLRGPLSPGK